jgi:hypothetical protein
LEINSLSFLHSSPSVGATVVRNVSGCSPCSSLAPALGSACCVRLGDA